MTDYTEQATRLWQRLIDDRLPLTSGQSVEAISLALAQAAQDKQQQLDEMIHDSCEVERAIEALGIPLSDDYGGLDPSTELTKYVRTLEKEYHAKLAAMTKERDELNVLVDLLTRRFSVMQGLLAEYDAQRQVLLHKNVTAD